MPRPPTPAPMTASSDRQRRFEAVYREHHGPILGYVLRRTDNPDDAAGVLGEVFLTAWRRLDELPEQVEARLWYVYDAVPWADDQVMLFVGPVWPQPAGVAPSPAGGAPVPSPSSTG